MSLRESHNIKCEECQKEFAIDEWNSINVVELPELCEQTIKGEIFRFVCPHCNKEQIIIYDCLYFDKDKKFMVQLLPEYPNKEYLFSSEEAKFITTFGKNLYRLASDYTSFIEKVNVLTDELNDKAVEMCKSVAYSTYLLNHKGKTPQNAFYVKHDDKVIAFQLMFEKSKPEFVSIPIDFYEKIVDKLKTSELSKETFSFKKIDIKWALTDEVSEFLKKL